MSLDASVAKLEKVVKKSTGPSTARTAAAKWVLEQGEEEAAKVLESAPFSWFQMLLPLVGGTSPKKKKVPKVVESLLALLTDAIKNQKAAQLCSWNCGEKSTMPCNGKYSVCDGVCVCCHRTPAPARARERPAPERSLRLRLTLALLRAQEQRPSLLYGQGDL